MEALRLLFWKLAFRKEFKKRTGFTGKLLNDCIDAELETWVDDSQEWKDWEPADAVAENLSYWGD